MTSLVSSEFAAFCQGQLRLLTQATSASLGAVYISEEWLGGESPGWLPVAVHPENAAAMLSGKALLAPAAEGNEATGELSTRGRWAVVDEAGQWFAIAEPEENSAQFVMEPISLEELAAEGELATESRLAARSETEKTNHPKQLLSARPFEKELGKEKTASEEKLLVSEFELESDWNWSSGEKKSLPHFDSLHQVMQPLVLDGRAVGMVVAARERQDWQSEDYGQLEKVAQTLSTACTMERRLRWLQTRVHQQEIAQEKQQDIIDNLLHQFRNPLTALRTFGKLLVRRLSPDDRNQAVAAGIVRESDRLQGLLTQIGETVEHFSLADPVVGELVAEPEPTQSRLLPARQAGNNGLEPGADDQSAGAGTPLALPQGARPVLPAARENDWSDSVSPLTGKPLVLKRHFLTELIGERLPSWQAIAQLREQFVVASLESGLSEILADGDALGEVLNNLVDNGLKYGSSGGTVTISVRSSSAGLSLDRGDLQERERREAKEPREDEGDREKPSSQVSKTQAESQPELEPEAWQCIAISDDGPGIPEGDIPRLFERHYRGVQAEGAKPGTGLGLAIARDLVEQMGGRIWIQSPAGAFHPKVIFELEDALEPALYPGSAFLVWLRGCSEGYSDSQQSDLGSG